MLCHQPASGIVVIPLQGAGGLRQGAPDFIKGVTDQREALESGGEVGKQIRIVENNAVLELLDISVWRVENIPPAPSGRALKGLMLYSGGVEL